jgi:hypothetical protein
MIFKQRVSQRFLIALVLINAGLMAIVGLIFNPLAIAAIGGFMMYLTFFLSYDIPPTKHLNIDLRFLILILLSSIMGFVLLWIGCQIFTSRSVCLPNEFRGAKFLIFSIPSFFAIVFWLFGRLPVLIKRQ